MITSIPVCYKIHHLFKFVQSEKHKNAIILNKINACLRVFIPAAGILSDLKRSVLLRVFDGTGFADDGDFDLTGIGHLFFNAGTDIFGKHLGIAFTDLLRSYDDTDLASGLKCEAGFNTVEFICNFLKFFLRFFSLFDRFFGFFYPRFSLL